VGFVYYMKMIVEIVRIVWILGDTSVRIV